MIWHEFWGLKSGRGEFRRVEQEEGEEEEGGRKNGDVFHFLRCTVV